MNMKFIFILLIACLPGISTKNAVCISKNYYKTVAPTTSYCNTDGSLWAYYPFDQDAMDKSGNDRKLELVKGANIKVLDQCENDSGNGLYLNGWSAYAVIDDGKFFPEGDFTIAFNLFPERPQGRIFQKGNYYTALGASFGITFYEETSELATSISHEENVCNDYTDIHTVNSLQSGISLEANKWYHIAMAHDHGYQKIYIDGKLVKSEPTDREAFKNCNEAPFNIGVWWRGGPRFFKGFFSELKIYTRGLEAQEIQNLANMKKASSLSPEIL